MNRPCSRLDLVFVALLCVLAAIGFSTLYAQRVPEAVVGWDIEVFRAVDDLEQGVPIPAIVTLAVLRSAVLCDQTPAAAGKPAVDPTEIRVADPDNPKRDCVLPLPSGLPDLPGLVVTVRARGETLVSRRSMVSNPFNETKPRGIAPPVTPAAPRVR